MDHFMQRRPFQNDFSIQDFGLDTDTTNRIKNLTVEFEATMSNVNEVSDMGKKFLPILTYALLFLIGTIIVVIVLKIK